MTTTNTIDQSTTSDNFREIMLCMFRVNPYLCEYEETTHGIEVAKMWEYYHTLDWKLGRRYLLKTIVECYMAEEYNSNIYKKYMNFVEYLENNYSYDTIVWFYDCLRGVMMSSKITSDDLIWKYRNGEPMEWPEALIPETTLDRLDMEYDYSEDISDTSEVTYDDESSDDYWNSYNSLYDEDEDISFIRSSLE